jgi:hypothetical protein
LIQACFTICFLEGRCFKFRREETRILTGRRDQKEGVGAFFEKRKPDFKGSVEEDAPPNFPWWSEVDTGRRAKAAKLQSKL